MLASKKESSEVNRSNYIEVLLKESYQTYSKDPDTCTELLEDIRTGRLSIIGGFGKLPPAHKAACVIAEARSRLNHFHRNLLESYYLDPDSVWVDQKDFYCVVSSYAIWERLGRDRNRWLVADITRSWAGQTPLKTREEWCKELDVHIYVLTGWITGNRIMDVSGVAPFLDFEFTEAKNEIARDFVKRGWIKH